MEFVFPTASPPVPALAHAAAPRLAAAVLRGSLDFAFEHAGLTYLVDWKSDSLASYGTDSVGRYAAEHYDDQLKIYALAMVKLLGIDEERAYAARFGGMAFCFLRGFDGEGRGLWFARPPFDALLTFGEALRSGRAFGQGRLS